ncbi:MAG: hypothetical protein H6Q73_3806 [Firmicutes bacterium]|nr:hypothetical protein [Bacillota bacterium]
MFRVRCLAEINGSKYLKDVDIWLTNDAVKAVSIAKSVFALAYDVRSTRIKVVRVW